MFTTLDIGGILELGCTIPASRQPSAASSAACQERQLIKKKTKPIIVLLHPLQKGAIIRGITLGTGKHGVHLAK